MEPLEPIKEVKQLMAQFAEFTGLSPVKKNPIRYLWTDAFAVCNFIGLYQQTSDPVHLELALALVAQVHNTLGHHRGDDSRNGWISGLGPDEGSKFPTKGGLRIGKELKERGPSDPYDENLEWERDGQYYHYLTKWMQALCQLGLATKNPDHHRWAAELVKAAHKGFVYESSFSREKMMYWKMSIDLSFPLVPSMGQHDPLDGLLTYKQIQSVLSDANGSLDLKPEIEEMSEICADKSWATDDSLGIGGLLDCTYKVGQLIFKGDTELNPLLDALLDESLISLGAFVKSSSWQYPVDYRLAFRELGLTIGLKALALLNNLIDKNPGNFENKDRLISKLQELKRFEPLLEIIETFWLDPGNRESKNWLDHRFINMVMLATSLSPEGFLTF